MPYGSELYQLLTSFDPYGAYTKGKAAPQEAAIEQQKRDVEQQKLSVQQKQLKELAGEKPAQEAPELAQMAQNPLGNDYTIKDAEGNSTFAAQAIPFVSKSAEIKKQIAKNQQDIKMATAFGDNNLAANLSYEGRRLIDDLTRSESKIQEMKQQGSDSIISNVSLGAKDQKSYENVVKSTMDKLGLVKRPNWLPETWTPDLKDQIRGYASDKTATAIDNALDRRESEKRAVEREKDRKTNQIAKERDDPLHYALLVKALNKGVGGEGGGKIKITSPVDKQLNEAEQSLVLSQKIESSLSDPKIAKSLNGTKLLRSLLETPKEMGSIDKIVRTNIFEKLPKDSQELVIELANLRNAYYKQQSGLAVTGGEAARNFFAVVQPTDNVETLITKLRVQKQKSLSILEDGIQDYKLPPGRERRYQEIIGKEKTSKETPKETPTETKKDSTKVPTVTTKEQYDALPEGAIYIEDGKQYQKPKKK